MRISLNWLKEYIELDLTVDELCEKLTMLGLEIESIERMGSDIEEVYIGEIHSIDPHPDADKLVVCKTDVGQEEPLQIVCGAKNMKVGDRVPTAVVGGSLPGDIKIAKRKMRGVESQGMMCSPQELGLGDDHDGLMILDKDAPIGADARETLGLLDTVLEIEVTPNRGDWASMTGVARELAAAMDREMAWPKVASTEGKTSVSSLSSVTLEAADLCPRYIGRVIQNVKIGPSPAWLVKKLAAAGQRPVNNVVDITNYVLLETGHPLHAFDYDKLNENRIVVRRATQGETITTIDHEEKKLGPDMLVIADSREPVAVAGVMGGFETEVGEGTTNLFIESAYFEPASIRRTARALNLITESSQRFQRGADPEMALYAANRACQLILELAGGELAKGVLDEYPKPVEQKRITLRFDRTAALLGATVPLETQRKYLTDLGFNEQSADSAQVTVSTPTWRHDASQEADLIEEVARLFGYDKIPRTVPKVRRREEELSPEFAVIRELKDFLVGVGLTEVMNWTFCNADDIAATYLTEQQGDMVALANPLSEKYTTMRPTLVPGLLKTVSNNVRKNARIVKVFETGPVYKPNDSDTLPDEGTRLGIALCGLRNEKHWSGDEHPADIFDLKGFVELVFQFFGARPKFEADAYPAFQAGQSAVVKVGKRTIGHLGAVQPKVLEAFEIDRDTYLAELDLEPLLTRKTERHRFTDIPAYPPSLRDMAVVVDKAVPAGELRTTAIESGGKLLQDAAIFDVYTGKQVPDGKKSIALSLKFQSGERTLTDKDTQKAWDKILKKLQEKHGAELR